MSKRFKISSVVVLVAFACVIASGVGAQDKWKKHYGAEDRLYNETFALEKGDRLRMEVQDADVIVMQGGTGEARVEVYVKARGDKEDAEDYFEDSRFEADVSDNTLRIETRFPRHRGWGFWDHHRHARMAVAVTIPPGTYARVRTDDGDIIVEDLDGDLRATTSDGDVIVGAIRANAISLKTSDGDIRAGDLNAREIDVESSDGDVRAGKIESETVTFSTSDGDVVIDDARGGMISMSTSDGDIRVEAAAEKVSARTSDGNITIGIASDTALNLRTQDGNVRIEAPAKIKADLDLRGERVTVKGGSGIKGDVGRHHVRGSLGGGGASIVARTSDGTISLDLR